MSEVKKQMSGTQWFLLGWIIISAALIIAALREGDFLTGLIGAVIAFASLLIGAKTDK